MNSREETFVRNLRIELEAATEDYKALWEEAERTQKERDHILNRIGLLKQLIQLENTYQEGKK